MDSDNKSIIVLKTARGRKAAYVRAARPGTLAAWIFRILDAAAGYKAPEVTRRSDAPDPRSE
jgi:hypothetical protein